MTTPDQFQPPADPYQQPADPAATPGAPETKKRSASAGQILAGLLFVVVIVFIIENSRQVRVRLIFPEVQAPLYVPILIAAVLGGVIGALLRYRRHRHHR
ncbi:MAG TPA: LapA family protein [Jatrophihabitans sp.]|jgi:uncharacterized integral membrane protein|uniref:LapA family protein n=1 Tax=Jatrophihabitans sp. TaxID=1932789 RepID=UPI002DF9A615|nr:LapA family protein [Jatrophihabitans sp.]